MGICECRHQRSKMLPSREVARDAGAQNSLAFELCRRDPGVSAGNDMLGDCNGIGVVLLIREAGDGQWAIVNDTPAIASKQCTQLVAHVESMLDVSPVTLPTEASEGKEQLQADEAARPLNRMRVGIDGGFCRRHVTRRHAEGIAEERILPAKEHAGPHRYGVPLVGVDSDRIRCLYSC